MQPCMMMKYFLVHLALAWDLLSKISNVTNESVQVSLRIRAVLFLSPRATQHFSDCASFFQTFLIKARGYFSSDQLLLCSSLSHANNELKCVLILTYTACMRDPEATSRWKNAAKSRAWWCTFARFSFVFTDSDHRFSSNNVQLQNTLFMISFFISCRRSSASLRKSSSGPN